MPPTFNFRIEDCDETVAEDGTIVYRPSSLPAPGPSLIPEGFGKNAAGGEGGAIVKVTSLADSGTGTLREALEDRDDPRIVTFDVGGLIRLEDQIEVGSNVTLNGLNGPAVGYLGARLRVVGQDIIIRGMLGAPGDGAGDTPGNRDGVSVGKRGATVKNVLIDHNCFVFCVDETVAAWDGPENVTFSNNIIAECLRNSIHPDGEHSMGALVGTGSGQPPTKGISFIKNFFASNHNRNPTVKDRSERVEFRNNYVYNHGENGLRYHEPGNIAVIGNVYQDGPNTPAAVAPIRPSTSGGFYAEDNIRLDTTGAPFEPVYVSGISTGAAPAFALSDMAVLPASETKAYVLANAGPGAQWPLIANRLRDLDTSWIDSPLQVGVDWYA